MFDGRRPLLVTNASNYSSGWHLLITQSKWRSSETVSDRPLLRKRCSGRVLHHHSEDDAHAMQRAVERDAFRFLDTLAR